MCRSVTCACGKASWAGCGQHVESVLGSVKDEDRCPAVRRGQPAIAPGSSRSPCPDSPAGRAAAAAAAAARTAAGPGGGGEGGVCTIA